MGNAQKALVMAAGIFLAIALITIAVIMFISAQDATKTAQGNFSAIQTDLAQTSFTVYDNTVISGSQVLNALGRFQSTDQFGIQVKTGRNKTNGIWYGFTVDANGVVGAKQDKTTINDFAKNPADNNYVNPSGKFDAVLVRDTNNVVRAIIFTQKDS
jgi:hypothetical protein